jgi:signal transduction histidine kinase/PAS domain-containing protein
METTAEIKRLQSCINDLISVLALPAIWSGSEASHILGTLLEVLLTMLRVDFVYARLPDASDGPAIEVVRLGDRRHFPGPPQQFGEFLDRWLDQTATRCVMPNPTGEGEVWIASFSLGLQDEAGLLVAGSRRPNFPTEVERLLLRVAANQAGIGLQEARRSGEQKRIAEMLEERVAERTSRLTAVNEELRRSEAYLAQAQRLSCTGSFGWKLSTGEIIWSDESFRIFQFDRTTRPTVELMFQRVHPEDAPMVRQTIERASKDMKNFEHEFRLLMPDRSIKYAYVLARAVTDELGSAEFVGAVMDVTERRRAEALRDGESRILEMIARDAPLEEIMEKLVWVVEAHFAGLFCSVLLLDKDGQHLRHGAAPSLPEAYTKAIDGLSIGPKAGSCGTAMYRKEPVVVTDILQDPLWEEYRAVAGPYGLRACWSTPIIARSSQVLGTFAMYYREPRSPSPAEIRALEMATHLAGIAIERKLAREEREGLRQLQAELAHINRVTTMGELTASLAHEVNQPIAAAITDANTCLRWLNRDQPDMAEAREAAARVVRDATRAAEIISRTRLLFKKASPQSDLVDVNEVIREMIVLLRSEAMQYSITVRTELTDLPPIMGDRVQLQQVLMNLVANGIDAMKEVDGIRELAIKSEKAENDHLLISVSDTGIGLPPQQKDQIFNAFFTTKPHGTGMGLRISRSIVESHGGRLWAAGNSHRGASFYITLPSRLEACA